MQIPGELALIPGYVDAVEHENKIRNAAMLNLNTRICGVEVRQMTLRHYLILDGIDSACLNGRLPDPDHCDIEKFLWVLSPEFTPRRWSWAKSRFASRVRRLPYGEAVTAIRQYVTDTFQDQPPSTARGKWVAPQWSFAASVIHSMCSNLHFTRDAVLDMPLKEIFQHMKISRIQAALQSGESPGYWNVTSDGVRMVEIRRRRAEMAAEKLAGTNN